MSSSRSERFSVPDLSDKSGPGVVDFHLIDFCGESSSDMTRREALRALLL